MKIETALIGELAAKEKGSFKIGPFGSSLKKSELVNGGIPVAGIENVLANKFVKGFRRFITPQKFDELADYAIRADDVLVTTMGTIGRAAVAPVGLGYAIIDSHLFRIRVDRKRVFAPYLCYGLNSDYVARQLDQKARGAIMEGLNTSILRECSIPLPDVPEQQRIAERLEKANRLRRMRRYALELSDTFLPATFLEIFGDPNTNSHNWTLAHLGDVLLSVQDGPHVSPHYSNEGVPFISTRNVRPGEIIWDDLKFISREDAAAQWRKVKPARGDILYTKGGTTGLAKVVDFDRDIAVWVHIAVLKLKTDLVVPIWLEHMLNSQFCYKQSQDLTFGIVNRDLGLKRMPRIKIYLPPMPLQREFAKLVTRTLRFRALQREALRQAEHLFQTLLHQAFKVEP